MEINLKENLNILTNIPIKYIEKIERDLVYSILDGIHDSSLNGESITEFISDIGSLLINVEEEEIKYKFIPSEKFEELLKTQIKSGQNLLENKLDKILVDRISNLYKDLF